MSGTNDQKVPPQHQGYYPPPPPGPPPGHANPLGSNPHQPYAAQQQSVPQHPNENPIPDYHNPAQQPHHTYQPDASELYGTDDPTPSQHQAGAAAAASPGPATTKPSWSSRFAGLGTKAAAPLNALANKMGSEAFLPGTMDKECEKAARILRGFCKEGIYSEQPTPQQQTTTAAHPGTDFKPPPTTATQPPPSSDPTTKKKSPSSRVLLTIPPKVIAGAQGLAIFTTVRAGFHVSGASGSGILVARRGDGSWSPPSGIQVHSVGAGFVVGLDIYDCVVVINTREALEAFTRTRMSLGSDLAVTAGPWGAGGSVDFGMPQGDKRKGRDDKNKGNNNMRDEKPVAAAGQSGTDHVYPTATTGPPGTATSSTAAPLSTPATGTSKDRKPSPFREAIRKPVYSYVKSRGFYAGVQVDGTVITERKEANAAFYGDRDITVERILRGDVRGQTGGHLWPDAARELLAALAGAEGRVVGQVQGQGQGQQGQWASHGQSTGQGVGYGTGAGYGTAPGYGTGPGYGTAPGYGTTPGHGTASGYGGPPGYTSGAGVPGVTEGVRNMDVNAGSSTEAAPQLPPRSSKAAEAAAEARANEPLPAGPPSYYEHPEAHHGDELPPAYVDDGVRRPGVGDVKGAPGPGH